MLVGGVQANTRLTFQSPLDFIEQISCWGSGAGTCYWTHNATGGNSYISVAALNPGGYPLVFYYMINAAPAMSAYAGASQLTAAFGNGGGGSIILLDSSYATMHSCSAAAKGRYEVKMIGGSANIYKDGVLISTSGALSQNPTYIGFGHYKNYNAWPGEVTAATWDDFVYGSSQPLLDTAPDKYIFGMPENGYFLQKDILNPPSSGFYRVNQTVANGSPTLITSFTFPSTFGKGNGNNETVYLNDYGGGNYQTYYTGTDYAGNIVWNLTAFFASGAPYGLYITTIPGSVSYSDTIPYIGSGATINFDKNSYAVGETATLSVEMTPSYYAAVTAPHVVIQDIYGTEVYNAPITLAPFTPNRIGTATYTWTSDEDEGVYYGLIYATYLGEEILMNYDTAELNSVLVVNGYVFNAETAGTITGATVNITQGVTTDSVASGFDGNYTSVSAFESNAPTTIVASKTGYETYQHVFTPLYAGVIQINLTLMPTNPTYTGIALGGIARTPPYNRTINSATVTIVNNTGGSCLHYSLGCDGGCLVCDSWSGGNLTTYTATTNSVGYYIQNNMPNANVWSIWGSKIGFSNSSVYQKLVVGI